MMQALEGVIGYSRMRTILVCNYKGGVGKTTVALHLAWLLEQARNPKKDPLPIGAVDADPQGSLAKWYARARSEGYTLPEVQLVSSWELPSRLGKMAAS